MPRLRPVKSFYAVTLSRSVYHVRISRTEENETVPMLLKIVDKGKIILKPEKFTSDVLAITDCLILFVPEGGDITPLQYEVMSVNIRCWEYRTNQIVALFLFKKSAITCSGARKLERCDSRWKKSTMGVLKAIGKEHPYCKISHAMAQFQLMKPEEWQ